MKVVSLGRTRHGHTDQPRPQDGHVRHHPEERVLPEQEDSLALRETQALEVGGQAIHRPPEVLVCPALVLSFQRDVPGTPCTKEVAGYVSFNPCAQAVITLFGDQSTVCLLRQNSRLSLGLFSQNHGDN